MYIGHYSTIGSSEIFCSCLYSFPPSNDDGKDGSSSEQLFSLSYILNRSSSCSWNSAAVHFAEYLLLLLLSFYFNVFYCLQYHLLQKWCHRLQKTYSVDKLCQVNLTHWTTCNLVGGCWLLPLVNVLDPHVCHLSYNSWYMLLFKRFIPININVPVYSKDK